MLFSTGCLKTRGSGDRQRSVWHLKVQVVCLLLVMLTVQNCTTSVEVERVGGSGAEAQVRELKVNQGDVVFIVSEGRARLVMRITGISEEGLTGVTLESERTSVNPEVIRFIPYNEIALLQFFEEDVVESELAAVAIITVIGALVLGAQMESAFDSMALVRVNAYLSACSTSFLNG